MAFVFKIPTFCKANYGIDIEVDKFCEEICNIANNGKYTSEIDKIDIIPFILPQDVINQGKGPILTKIDKKYRVVVLSRRIDFNSYMSTGIEGKKVLLTECLIKALEEVGKKIDFNIDDFRKGIEKLL